MDKDEIKVLRELARQVAEAARHPVMEERRRMWKSHNSLRRARPMVLVFPEGSWRELLLETSLECRSEEARDMEARLRVALYYRDHIPDDNVITGEWIVEKAVTSTDWGLEGQIRPSSSSIAWQWSASRRHLGSSSSRRLYGMPASVSRQTSLLTSTAA